jgi:hypothetical protein
MERARKFVVTNLWWIVLLIAVALLVSHTFGVQRIAVDNTSLVLLLLILISPFVAAIKRVKFGEFEAEIEPEEVKRVTASAEKSLPALAEEPRPLVREPGDEIKRLAENDPIIALAKLRIEFETRLRRLSERVGFEPRSPAALSSVIRELVAREVFPPPFGAALRDVIAICNRAIHGEEIRDTDARQMIDTGVDLLRVLDRTVREYGLLHPVDQAVITPEERDSLQQARYRLTTVIPYTENPQRRVYVVTQDELDVFVEGYAEHAEFMIALERSISEPEPDPC